MIRARIAVIATLVGVSLAGTSLLAQTAPEMKPILGGRKVEQPIKGQADIEFLAPVTKRNGAVVTTVIKVKNVSSAPIQRLSITESWFDKAQKQVTSSQGALEQPLDAGAVDTVTIQTAWSERMSQNQWQFSHANGTIKPHKVAKLEDGKSAPAAAKAPAKKK